MQVLGVVGSMRKDGQTNALVNRVIDEMGALDPDVDSTVIHLVDVSVHPCRVVCSSYCLRRAYRCSISDDVPQILDRMIAADAVILGAPLYFRGPPAKFQALTERLISMFFFLESRGEAGGESPLRGKPCGLVGVTEYSNPHQVLEYLHDFCTVLNMCPVLLDRFPYLGVAGQGDVEQDVTFHPFERSWDLAEALVLEVGRIHAQLWRKGE